MADKKVCSRDNKVHSISLLLFTEIPLLEKLLGCTMYNTCTHTHTHIVQAVTSHTFIISSKSIYM